MAVPTNRAPSTCSSRITRAASGTRTTATTRTCSTARATRPSRGQTPSCCGAARSREPVAGRAVRAGGASHTERAAGTHRPPPQSFCSEPGCTPVPPCPSAGLLTSVPVSIDGSFVDRRESLLHRTARARQRRWLPAQPVGGRGMGRLGRPSAAPTDGGRVVGDVGGTVRPAVPVVHVRAHARLRRDSHTLPRRVLGHLVVGFLTFPAAIASAVTCANSIAFFVTFSVVFSRPRVGAAAGPAACGASDAAHHPLYGRLQAVEPRPLQPPQQAAVLLAVARDRRGRRE